MKNLFRKSRGAILLLITALLLASCAGGAPATPTTDPNAILTEVAETVMVSFTQTAEAMPTSTQTPILPTSTPELSTPEIVETPTTYPVVIPGMPTPTVQRYGDSAWWAAQVPADGTQIKVGTVGVFHGCLINNGTTTWTSAYNLVFTSGWNSWPSRTSWPIGSEILPGKKWCYDMPIVYPGDPGEYMTRWYFKNSRDAVILEVYYHFYVIP
jgi:hypothetical protein